MTSWFLHVSQYLSMSSSGPEEYVTIDTNTVSIDRQPTDLQRPCKFPYGWYVRDAHHNFLAWHILISLCTSMRRRLLVRHKQLSKRRQQLLQQTTHPDLAAILGYIYTRGDQFIRTKHTKHSIHSTRANKTHTHTQAYSYELKRMLTRRHTLPFLALQCTRPFPYTYE